MPRVWLLILKKKKKTFQLSFKQAEDYGTHTHFDFLGISSIILTIIAEISIPAVLLALCVFLFPETRFHLKKSSPKGVTHNFADS